ncbi:MAG: three-Cys-motif partner protein TcmP [Pirellulales bacterium]
MAKLPKMVPHTAAKHFLLKRYLDAWFPILGKHHARISYIDGFAGPGEYEDGEDGSPILAIEAAKAHVANGTLAPNVNISFIFAEAKSEYADHLRSRLNTLTIPAQFNAGVIPGEFADVIGSILDQLEKERKQIAPTFAFVDPFGFSGIPFALMTRILAYPRCEVFVNIMVEFINRFLEHPNDKVVAHFPTTFGTDEVLKIPTQSGDRAKALLSLYKKQLQTKAKFVGQFDMHGCKDQKTYSLFFASNSPLGFEKMKEAMWSVDKSEGGKFSDFEPGAGNQPHLFTLEALWTQILDRFRGRLVLMAEVERFVVQRTDFLRKHAREVLTDREQKSDVSVELAAGYKRRKGTFKSDKVSIRFPN